MCRTKPDLHQRYNLGNSLVFLLLMLCNSVLSAETLHAIIIAETSDPGIRNSVEADAHLAEEFAGELGRHFSSASVRVLNGEAASRTVVLNAIESIDLESDDFVFVFYSGHGDESAAGSPWPIMSLVDGGMEGRDLLLALASKHSLRHLVVFDACNGRSQLPISRAPASTSFRSRQIDLLFKNVIGSVVFASSESGFVSYADVDGGPSRFSRVFFEVMNSSLSSTGRQTWRQLAERVKRQTVALSSEYQQVPKYLLSPGL